jgi:hypothetical protein
MTKPLTARLSSASRAADAGYLALVDVAQIASDMEAEYRIVGGHMVTLLAAVHGVSDQVALRETLDVDVGVLPRVAADPRLVDALAERGYVAQGGANRFVRRHGHDGLELVVDVLAPADAGVMRSNRRHGALVLDEIPGLALALGRPPTTVELRVTLLGGTAVTAVVKVPDLVSALCIKAAAYRGRFADKDAVDLWRLMTAAFESGLRSEAWPIDSTANGAAAILRRFFGRPSSTGLVQVSSRRDVQARMRAMTKVVVGT